MERYYLLNTGAVLLAMNEECTVEEPEISYRTVQKPIALTPYSYDSGDNSPSPMVLEVKVVVRGRTIRETEQELHLYWQALREADSIQKGSAILPITGIQKVGRSDKARPGLRITKMFYVKSSGFWLQPDESLTLTALGGA